MSQNLSGTESYCKGTTEQQKHTARAVLTFMFHYRVFGLRCGSFLPRLCPAIVDAFGCIVVAEWVHQYPRAVAIRVQTGRTDVSGERFRLHFGRKKGARKWWESLCRHSLTRQQQSHQMREDRADKQWSQTADIAPDAKTHQPSQRGNRRKSTAWLNARSEGKRRSTTISRHDRKVMFGKPLCHSLGIRS